MTTARAAAVTVMLLVSFAMEARSEGPVLTCGQVGPGESIRIDGRLAEPAWHGADWNSNFRQSVPHWGEPASEPTSVAFLCDQDAIYVAVRCDDSRPDLIRANKLRHRDEPQSDDHVEVVFDTYRDQVRGTVFVVNALGAREEGLINGPHRYTWSWNGVWEAKAARTAAGWQVEMRIPLRLLRYASGADREWGVNVERVVRRTQEESYLVPPRPPFGIASLDYAAVLTGLDLTARQRNLQVIPYALVGAVDESDAGGGADERSSISELGLDVKYALTSDLTLDATYNTDFAQVESDTEQVNLTRFSLFYPEKREFFLDNAELFSFGESSVTSPHGPSVSPFFSRRIGLYRGSTVPIDGGARLTGKAGRYDIGLLSIGTAGVAELDLASAWYNVARVRRDLGGRSYVGAIVTDSRRGGFHSTTWGADGTWFITRPLSLRASILAVDDSSTTATRRAWTVALDLTTDPWGFLFTRDHVDADFDPDLGFVRRDDYRHSQALLRRSIRPEVWGVRRVTFRTNNEWFESISRSTLESRRNNVDVEAELENGDYVALSFEHSFERLFDPFELDETLVFDVGGYAFDRTELSYYSDESRRWGVDASASGGEYFDGDRTDLEAEVWMVASRHVRAACTYAVYDISTDHGALDWRLWGVRFDYTHSATLSASTFVQYNSSSGTTTTNFRIRWILPNDSDVFLVVNDRREDLPDQRSLHGREVALKVSYRFFL